MGAIRLVMPIHSIKKCIHCGNEFIVRYASQISIKTCSRSCHISLNNKNRHWKQSSKNKISSANKGHLVGTKNPNFKGNASEFICKNCDKKFIVAQYQINAKKHGCMFCSCDCNYAFKAKDKISDDQNTVNRKFRRCMSYYIKHPVDQNKSKWFKYLGYSFKEMREHLESLFLDGMTWDNYGAVWHVDHKKPVSYFNFNYGTDDGFKQCWALSNLQPLFVFDNLSKGGKNTKVNQLIYT